MSGWMCRAPKLMTGSGAAVSTHSRAAVAQPVDWASIPRNAVSYRPNWRYRARIRSTISLGATRSPSLSASSCVSAGSARGEDVAKQVLRLIDAAQDGRLAGEDLHRDDGVEAFLAQDALRAREVDVRRIPGQDLGRGPRSAHAPSARSSSRVARIAGRGAGRLVRSGGECSVRRRLDGSIGWAIGRTTGRRIEAA